MQMHRCTPEQKRTLLTHLAGHPASPLTPAQKVAILRALRDLHWVPREEDTPVPFALVEAWYDDVFGRRTV